MTAGLVMCVIQTGIQLPGSSCLLPLLLNNVTLGPHMLQSIGVAVFFSVHFVF